MIRSDKESKEIWQTDPDKASSAKMRRQKKQLGSTGILNEGKTKET